MLRDDSFLYSGLTSQVGRAKAAQRAVKQQEKTEDAAKLTPVQQLINELIEHEKAKVVDATQAILSDMSETEWQFDKQLRREKYDFIVKFQTSVNNILREPKSKREAKQ